MLSWTAGIEKSSTPPFSGTTVRNYFESLSFVAEQLRDIAQAELDEQPLSKAQMDLVKRV